MKTKKQSLKYFLRLKYFLVHYILESHLKPGRKLLFQCKNFEEREIKKLPNCLSRSQKICRSKIAYLLLLMDFLIY